jgi:hypothetical protein
MKFLKTAGGLKDPIEVEAQQFHMDSLLPIIAWLGSYGVFEGNKLTLLAPEGSIPVFLGDYIIKEGEGWFSRCPARKFEIDYTPLD